MDVRRKTLVVLYDYQKIFIPKVSLSNEGKNRRERGDSTSATIKSLVLTTQSKPVSNQL